MSVNSKMTAIADAIRAKTGGTELLTLDVMAQDIAAIDTSKPEQTKTATPSLSQQTISPDSGKVLSGVTVEPITSTLLTSLDSDFKAENIAEGVNMFGVAGTHAGGAAMETCTISFTGENTFRFNGTTLDGFMRDAQFAAGDTVTVLKNSMIAVTINAYAMSTRITGEFTSATLFYTLTKLDSGGTWTGEGSGVRIIGFVGGNLTIYADVD